MTGPEFGHPADCRRSQTSRPHVARSIVQHAAEYGTGALCALCAAAPPELITSARPGTTLSRSRKSNRAKPRSPPPAGRARRCDSSASTACRGLDRRAAAAPRRTPASRSAPPVLPWPQCTCRGRSTGRSRSHHGDHRGEDGEQARPAGEELVRIGLPRPSPSRYFGYPVTEERPLLPRAAALRLERRPRAGGPVAGVGQHDQPWVDLRQRVIGHAPLAHDLRGEVVEQHVGQPTSASSAALPAGDREVEHDRGPG